MNGNLKTFERGLLNPLPFEDFAANYERLTGSREHAEAQYDKLLEDEIWLNDEYQVNIDKNPECVGFPNTVVWHLSIKRRGKNPIHDWRDLQAIKNTLVGPDYDAIELYPKASRTVDGANQHHLWVFIEAYGVKGPTFPIGWGTRAVTSNPNFPGTVQRPLRGAGDRL
jgi:hypothetical protein